MCRRLRILYPGGRVSHEEFFEEGAGGIDSLMPALTELPMIMVVQPAYHCEPKGGQGNFLPSGNRRLSWERVFATSFG